MQQQNYELSLLITALATVRAQRGLGAAGKRLAGSRGDAGTQRGEQGAELPPPCSLGAFGASWISRHLIYSAAFLPREKHQLLIKRTHFCSSVIPVLPLSLQGRGAVNYLASPFSHQGGTVSVVGCHRAGSPGSQLSPSTNPSPTAPPNVPDALPKQGLEGICRAQGRPQQMSSRLGPNLRAGTAPSPQQLS